MPASLALSGLYKIYILAAGNPAVLIESFIKLLLGVISFIYISICLFLPLDPKGSTSKKNLYTQRKCIKRKKKERKKTRDVLKWNCTEIIREVIHPLAVLFWYLSKSVISSFQFSLIMIFFRGHFWYFFYCSLLPKVFFKLFFPTA